MKRAFSVQQANHCLMVVVYVLKHGISRVCNKMCNKCTVSEVDVAAGMVELLYLVGFDVILQWATCCSCGDAYGAHGDGVKLYNKHM